jgi:DNA mismatch repair ATPase MutS
MTNIHNIWKNENMKKNISKLLISIYTLDIINEISKIKFNKLLSIPEYNNTVTKLWNIKNPLLDDKQISNPVNLSKNFIITGPNAAGKTTYVKSILSNIILSQTIGLTYSKKSSMIIYDCIYSFMRISDELGTKSYFEAEAELCANMIEKANNLIDSDKKGIFFMDEPMHSTPPTEGIATAFAVAEKLGNNRNINLIITTHFYKLTNLEKIYPNRFINLSVNAIENNDNSFTFPYKIKRGSSKQCIAIELLYNKNFPLDVINAAKNMKKIICDNILD